MCIDKHITPHSLIYLKKYRLGKRSNLYGVETAFDDMNHIFNLIKIPYKMSVSRILFTSV